ncbi:metal-dependent hydrolase [Archangium violaceum]|uniref:metal-dependent hydrolase n=1 Tax=Archangium violaceum TaxID=83451 RepID=UPI002B2EBC6A|nr:metal-dependent hydrolase [Archangium violaceum]
MDNLTHGLLGLALGALRRPEAPAGSPLTPTDKAVLLGSVLAAELPDLDTLLPAANSVDHALRAHRGLSHALAFAPVVALAATGLALLFFRRARFLPVYVSSLLALAVAHLLPDLWTGWGTRLLLPFSDQRLTLDWTMVVDPLVTLPLLVSAGVAWRRRTHWRRALLVGLACSAAYVGLRGVLQATLTSRVREAWPSAERVQVFPAWLSLTTWRYVVVLPSEYVAGTVSPGEPPLEERRLARPAPEVLTAAMRAVPTVHEALAWARFPVVSSAPGEGGRTSVRIGDLRYHLHGEPTLTFVLEVGSDLSVSEARLERGGSARELIERWRTVKEIPSP